MKPVFLFSLITTAGLAAHAQADTLLLKNGKKLAGKIVLSNSPNAAKIGLITALGKEEYSPDSVQMLQFCSAKNEACVDKSEPTLPCNTASSSSLQPSLISKMQAADLAQKGKTIFVCRMCGGEAKLLIESSQASKPVQQHYSITLAEHVAFFSQHAVLPVGEYNWKYEDTQKNVSSGSFTIKAGETKTIALFENEP